MPKVRTSLGLTLQLAKDANEYLRVETEVSGIDTDLPLEPQLEQVQATASAVLDHAQKIIDDKLEELMKRKVFNLD